MGSREHAMNGDGNLAALDRYLDEQDKAEAQQEYEQQCLENDCVLHIDKLKLINEAYNALMPVFLEMDKEPLDTRIIYATMFQELKYQASGEVDEIKTIFNASDFDIDCTDFIYDCFSDAFLRIAKIEGF